MIQWTAYVYTLYSVHITTHRQQENKMPRSGYKVTTTPAQFRDSAREWIRQWDEMDRQRKRADFLENMITSTRFRYSLAQMRAAAEGLKLGMNEGTR